MNILLNGVGRIGKLILRLALEKQDFNIVAINEINQNIENIAYVINYDSTYGRLEDKFNISRREPKWVSKIKDLSLEEIEQVKFAARHIHFGRDVNFKVMEKKRRH